MSKDKIEEIAELMMYDSELDAYFIPCDILPKYLIEAIEKAHPDKHD